jgi:hypothetical protein
MYDRFFSFLLDYLVGELVQWHTDGSTILDIRLMLCVVELG